MSNGAVGSLESEVRSELDDHHLVRSLYRTSSNYEEVYAVRMIFVRRFTTSDQITHLLNAIAWAILSGTGIAIGAALRTDAEPSRVALGAHFFVGLALCAVLFCYVFFARARFKRMVHELMRRDRPFWGWLKCLGGYPHKWFGSPSNSTVPPQGRYNAGQRIAYSTLIVANFVLVGTGLALFLLHEPNGMSSLYEGLRAIHSTTFIVSALILAAHIPMGLASTDSLRALLSFGQGLIPHPTLAKTAALWVAEDLELERSESSRSILKERKL